jgi:DNA polymerase
MLVGEQPGDYEDREGSPFVGPAGRLLDRALDEAGIKRQEAYVTNVVKHFKWEARGKLRLHKKPSAGEVAACQPWLSAEIEHVKPGVVVCLGATSAQALLGSAFRVTERRGQFVCGPMDMTVMATIHPSAIVRIRDHEVQEEEFSRLVADLSLAARRAEKPHKHWEEGPTLGADRSSRGGT